MTVSPILVIGMHRSGTSFLVEAMQQLGVFMGAQQDQHHEARLFLGLNEWLASQCGAAWDYPDAFAALERDEESASLLAEYLKAIVHGPRALSYLGPRRFLTARTPSRLKIAWGWKDPRNTYTLPIWLRVFPNARVIHIARHGMDVAESLRVRSDKSLTAHRRQMKLWRAASIAGIRQKRFVDSVRCRTIEGGLSLWTEYMTRAHEHMRRLGERALDIRYETLLGDPASVIPLVAEFCEVSAKGKDRIAASIKSDRGLAWTRDASLRAIGAQYAESLGRFGY